MFDVTIHTDGACAGNPGIGGYGAILVYGENEKVVRGFAKAATNNRMELMAIVEGLKALRKPCNVIALTDSMYLIKCFRHDEEWLLMENRPNRDLWQILLDTQKKGQHKIVFQKVKGHSGEVYNERCDRIAKEQIKKCAHMIVKGEI